MAEAAVAEQGKNHVVSSARVGRGRAAMVGQPPRADIGPDNVVDAMPLIVRHMHYSGCSSATFDPASDARIKPHGDVEAHVVNDPT
ncbi:MAG TPA: hypothetical protein VFJ15_02125 [Oleiagrimonas sp.]|nr:hypothetical protein [Oleiagrimonas sp.]